MNESEYVALSQCDVDRIETDLYPGAKRGVWWVSAILLIFCFIAPYVPGRFGARALVETMQYPVAFLLFFLVFSSLVYYFYRKSVYVLRADLLEGKKLIFRTRITRKSWQGQEKFELSLESLPKALSREKFIFPVNESHCFHEGDMVVLEYLGRSSILLKIYAEL